jgi:hypothetical protein
MTITQPRLKPIVGALGVSALLVTVGCGAGTGQGAFAQPGMTASASASQPGAPIVVSCEPNQRTLVRQVIVNGATLSQVECITNGSAPISSLTSTQPFAAPVTESYRQVRAVQPVIDDRGYDRGDDLGDARVLPVSQPTTVARPMPTRQVVYTDARPVRKARSVKKSAIIIGSSAGAGAGVGAAVGGKKGALIGAAIGGGGAALWDQLTRRDR